MKAKFTSPSTVYPIPQDTCPITVSVLFNALAIVFAVLSLGGGEKWRGLPHNFSVEELASFYGVVNNNDSNSKPIDSIGQDGNLCGLIGQLVALGQRQDAIFNDIEKAVQANDRQRAYKLVCTLIGNRR